METTKEMHDKKRRFMKERKQPTTTTSLYNHRIRVRLKHKNNKKKPTQDTHAIVVCSGIFCTKNYSSVVFSSVLLC